MIYFGIKAIVIGDFVLSEPIKSYHKGFEVSLFIDKGSYKNLGNKASTGE